MAENDTKSMFGDINPRPDSADDAARRRRDTDSGDQDVSVNDEDREPGGLRSDRPERPSTADDMKNPRTGPIG